MTEAKELKDPTDLYYAQPLEVRQCCTQLFNLLSLPQVLCVYACLHNLLASPSFLLLGFGLLPHQCVASIRDVERLRWYPLRTHRDWTARLRTRAQENIFEWHFTVRGPDDTPFAGGIYHGRILLPPEYPFKPPSIILLTVCVLHCHDRVLTGWLRVHACDELCVSGARSCARVCF